MRARISAMSTKVFLGLPCICRERPWPVSLTAIPAGPGRLTDVGVSFVARFKQGGHDTADLVQLINEYEPAAAGCAGQTIGHCFGAHRLLGCVVALTAARVPGSGGWRVNAPVVRMIWTVTS